jgi:sulfur-carrier protein
VQSENLPSVKILFFGATAEAAGAREENLDLSGMTTVGEALKTILNRHPRLSGHKLLIAVNEEYVSPETFLNVGDELAVFTAVSGG